MRRPRRVIRRKAFELACALHELCVRGHDLGRLAVKRQADLIRLRYKALAGGLQAAHDELEVRVVVALIGPDHEEFTLAIGASVQPVRAVEHEYLERSDAVPFD